MNRSKWLLVLGTISATGAHARAGENDTDVLGLVVDNTAGAIENASTSAPGTLLVNTTGLLWSHSVTADGRRPRSVSLGDHGSQVFADLGGADGAQHLFSAFDDATPTPVWESARHYHTSGNKVASSEANGSHVVLSYAKNADAAPYHATLAKFSSSSSTPEWTYSFPGSVPSSAVPHGGVGISRDGKRIVAWSYKTSPNELIVTAFEASSSTPISESYVRTDYEPRSTQLSADASTLLVVTQDRTRVVDVRTSQILQYDINWFGVGNGHAISGDGSTYAKSLSDRVIDIYRRTASGYSLMSTPAVDANWQCAQAALSDDGSLLVCAWGEMLGLTDVRLQIYDLHGTTAALVWDRVYDGSGSLNNIAMDLAMSANGSAVALGFSGDEAGNVPELVALRRDAQTGAWSTVVSHAFAGSVWDVDLSADGKMLAVASSSTHLDAGAVGGDVSLFALTQRDLIVEGVPRAGNTVYIHQYMRPGADGGLYVSPTLAQKPHEFAGVGTLHLQRNNLSFTPLLMAGTDGIVTRAVVIPTDELGTTTYYQGLEVNPVRLSDIFISMTVLP